MGKSLKVYIDESGDLGVRKSSANLLVISSVAIASDADISEPLATLELKLLRAKYAGMIHVAPLVNKRDNSDYTNFGLGRRRAIYWSLFHFMMRSQLKARTFIINKGKLSSGVALRQEADHALSSLYQSLARHLKEFEKIVIYYDGGQPVLQKILRSYFNGDGFEIVSDFDHMDRIFQATDLLTFTDKLLFKYEHDMELTGNERRFFTDDDIRLITKMRRAIEL